MTSWILLYLFCLLGTAEHLHHTAIGSKSPGWLVLIISMLTGWFFVPLKLIGKWLQ